MKAVCLSFRRASDQEESDALAGLRQRRKKILQVQLNGTDGLLEQD